MNAQKMHTTNMNLFVGNLSQETTAASLQALFSEFGAIVSSKVIKDNATGMSRGFGFVEMADKGNAFDAIDNLDATFFEGNIISVKEAKQNNTKSTGTGFKPSYGNSKPSYPRPSFNRPSSSGPRPNPRPSSDSDDRFNRL
jgi:RNA recognition motif-containing protein